MKWLAGVATGGDRGEAQGKTKFIYSDPRDKSHGTSGRATWERLPSGQKAEERNEGSA